MKEQIEVITYEQERLNYFTVLMAKAQRRYKRLCNKHKNAPYISYEAETVSDAGREAQFCKDVVEMLEKGYHKQSKGEWIGKTDYAGYGYYCSNCNAVFTGENAEWIAKEHYYCPKCGAKMKGGVE